MLHVLKRNYEELIIMFGLTLENTTTNYKYGAQQEKSLHLVSSSVLAGLELNSITR